MKFLRLALQSAMYFMIRLLQEMPHNMRERVLFTAMYSVVEQLRREA